METFNHYSNDENVTLFSFDGNSNGPFYAINTKETIIVRASAHDGDPFEVAERQYTAVERLKKINALYLSSLENMGVDGSLEDGTYTYPHAGNTYVIEKDPEALNKTIFIAYYENFNGNMQGRVNMHGGFVENNLDHTVFVEMTSHKEETGNIVSTSQATPKLATFGAKIFQKHPEFTAEEIKFSNMPFRRKSLFKI